MNENNLKNLIDIPKELDSVINAALEKGKEDKQKSAKSNKKKLIQKASVAAAVVLCSTITIGTINPNIASAFPAINKVFETFNTSLFGESTTKFQDVAQSIGQCKTNKGASITLNEAVLDDNVIMLALTVESDYLKNSKHINEQDFFSLHQDITINGQSVNSIKSNVKKIDDTTGSIILTSNLSEFTLDDNADVELNIFHLDIGSDYLSGKWNFKFNLSKEPNGKKIVINPSINSDGFKIDSIALTMSDLTNTLKLTGNAKDSANPRITPNILVRDNNDKYFLAKRSSSSCSNIDGNFTTTYEIKGDLSNSEFIEIIPTASNTILSEEVNGRNHTILKCTGSNESEYERKIISRNATEAEINDGYVLNTVEYYINIDKKREFKSINELINSEIKVSSKESVTIQNIEATDEYTKIFFKASSLYDYMNFSQTVIFDENMNDTCLGEDGLNPAIEDIKNNIFSIKLDSIDATKKYKIAVPMIPEINVDKYDWKETISLT